MGWSREGPRWNAKGSSYQRERAWSVLELFSDVLPTTPTRAPWARNRNRNVWSSKARASPQPCLPPPPAPESYCFWETGFMTRKYITCKSNSTILQSSGREAGKAGDNQGGERKPFCNSAAVKQEGLADVRLLHFPVLAFTLTLAGERSSGQRGGWGRGRQLEGGGGGGGGE
ncbi:hypothetical protein GOP47_0002581 [Adiantum capillus-veneris]|uniref:Uncharacterized protein n=1 Tax=Adiantum capillus-veneris TaxID=13818 RepID=A0A9D4ZP89_ADICA|nr:hypothetical protein GOP47_0002581 [Adiantum capillus-veneris]